MNSEKAVAFTATATMSTACLVPTWAKRLSVFIPAIGGTAASLTVEVSRDNSAFFPVLDPSDGDDLLVLKAGSDPAFIDLTRFCHGYFGDSSHDGFYVRLLKSEITTATASVPIFAWGD